MRNGERLREHQIQMFRLFIFLFTNFLEIQKLQIFEDFVNFSNSKNDKYTEFLTKDLPVLFSQIVQQKK